MDTIAGCLHSRPLLFHQVPTDLTWRTNADTSRGLRSWRSVGLDFLLGGKRWTGNMSRLLEGDFILGHHDIRISRGKKSLPFSRGRIQVLMWKSKLFLPSRATRRVRMEVLAPRCQTSGFPCFIIKPEP